MPTPTQMRENRKMTPQERAKDCFDILTNKFKLELCFKATAAKISTTANLLNTGITRMDPFNLKSYEDYCRQELEKNGIVACNTLPKPASVNAQEVPEQQTVSAPVADEMKVAAAEEKAASTEETVAEPVKKEVASTEETVVEPVKEEVASTEETVAEPVKEEVASTEEAVAEPVKEEVASTEETVAEPVKEEVVSTGLLDVTLVPDDQAIAAVGVSISNLNGNILEDDLKATDYTDISKLTANVVKDDLRVENYTLQSIELTSPESTNLNSEHIDL